MRGYLIVWDVPMELRQVSETPRLTGFETTVEEGHGMFNILRAIVARACREALRRVKPVAKAVAIAAAIGGLTRLASAVGDLGLDASTTAYVTALIAYAVLELRGIE